MKLPPYGPHSIAACLDVLPDNACAEACSNLFGLGDS